MATLQVRDVDDKLYESLRKRAAREKRSISQEVIVILEKYLSRPSRYDVNPTDEFLSLAGAWRDDREADEIISDIRGSRTNSSRFSGSDSVFD
ncbi:MAG: FitA-like ribbon-helix-helix domain-containing protein [Alkalispirochaetaceae bacterium]